MTNGLLERATAVLGRAFPVPRYLSVPAAGVNISDYSVKHIFIDRLHGVPRVVSFGKLDIPLGTVERGEIKDPAVLVKTMARLKEEYGYTYVHVALPEEHAYLFQITLPKGTRAELAQLIEFKLKENVPLGAEEAVFDFSIVREVGEQYELTVSVYPITIVAAYLSVLDEVGLVPYSIEIEGQATARALLPGEHIVPTLILDIGRNEASLSISNKGIVTFTATLETGGDLFTRAIARGLNLSFQEAERLKRKYGFRDTKESKDVFEQLLPVISEFKETIRKHLMYWHMHTSSDGGAPEEVAKIVLAGGNANIIGVAEYLEAELGVPVEMGNVWNAILSIEDELPNMDANTSLEFATAIGLAERSLARSV